MAEEEQKQRKIQAKLAKMPKVVDLNGLKPLELDPITDDEQDPPKKLMIKP